MNDDVAATGPAGMFLRRNPRIRPMARRPLQVASQRRPGMDAPRFNSDRAHPSRIVASGPAPGRLVVLAFGWSNAPRRTRAARVQRAL